MQHFTNDALLHSALYLGRGVRDIRERLAAALYFGELKVELNPETYQPEVTIEGQRTGRIENLGSWLNKVKRSIYFDAWHAMEDISCMFDYYRNESILTAQQVAQSRYKHNLNHSGKVYYGTIIWKAIAESTFVTNPDAEQPEYLRPYGI